jgi:hypothetical protein
MGNPASMVRDNLPGRHNEADLREPGIGRSEHSTVSTTARSATELAEALSSGEADIVVDGRISGSPMITLPPGTTLRGGELVFGAKGVRLTKDNTLLDITVRTEDVEVAIFNDTSADAIGTLVFDNVRKPRRAAARADESAPSTRGDALAVRVRRCRGRRGALHGGGGEHLALHPPHREARRLLARAVPPRRVVDAPTLGADHRDPRSRQARHRGGGERAHSRSCSGARGLVGSRRQA